MDLTILDDCDHSHQEGVVIKNNIAFHDLRWSLSADLYFTYPLSCSDRLIRIIFHTYLYVQAGLLLPRLGFPSLSITISKYSPLVLKPYS